MADVDASSLKRVPAVTGLGQALKAQSDKAREAARPVGLAAASRLNKAKTSAKHLQEQIVKMVKDPKFQTMTITTAGGAITIGAVGGAFGTATGVVAGSAVGLVPALLTFGVSIPIGAVVGGCGGLLVGATAGGSAGGAAGFGVYKYRVQIKDGFVMVKVKTEETAHATQERVLMLADKVKETTVSTIEGVKHRTFVTLDTAKTKAKEAATFAKVKTNQAVELATATRAGVTSTAAVTGGAVGGVAGGAVGAIAGAAAGVVPAIFTLGLSIPVGAAIGLFTGAAAGGSAGVIGGATAGYTGFTYRKEIHDSAKYIKTKAIDSAQQASQRVKQLVGAGTGGTA